MTYTYNPDDTLDGLIEDFAYDRDTAQMLPAATEAELEALSDEITRRLEVNAAWRSTPPPSPPWSPRTIPTMPPISGFAFSGHSAATAAG